MGAKARLGDILLEAGEIDAAQLEAALREQEENGGPLGMTLVRMGALGENTLVQTLADQLSLPMARLEGKRVSSEVLDLVPFELAQKHHCFPLFVKEEGDVRSLYLGMEDASDLAAIEEVAAATGAKIRPVLIAPSEIEEALERNYHARSSGEPAPLPVTSAATDPAAPVASALPPPPTDPGFDGTGLSPDLGDFDAEGPSVGDAEFDSEGLRDGEGEFDVAGGAESFASEDPLEDDENRALDESPLAADLDAVAPDPEFDRLGGDSLDDSLAEFGPELELDAPGTDADIALDAPASGAVIAPVAPEPQAQADVEPAASGPVAAPEPAAAAAVSRDAILRALTQLLVEKGVIDRDELIARVHRENSGDDA